MNPEEKKFLNTNELKSSSSRLRTITYIHVHVLYEEDMCSTYNQFIIKNQLKSYIQQKIRGKNTTATGGFLHRIHRGRTEGHRIQQKLSLSSTFAFSMFYIFFVCGIVITLLFIKVNCIRFDQHNIYYFTNELDFNRTKLL